MAKLPPAMGRTADGKVRNGPYAHSWMEGLRRLPREAGQAAIEYTILMVALATIGVGVLFLAGNSLALSFNDVTYDIVHSSDPAPVTVSPHACPDGTVAVVRHNKWRCKNE